MVFHPDEKYLKIQEDYYKSLKELQISQAGFNVWKLEKVIKEWKKKKPVKFVISLATALKI